MVQEQNGINTVPRPVSCVFCYLKWNPSTLPNPSLLTLQHLDIVYHWYPHGLPMVQLFVSQSSRSNGPSVTFNLMTSSSVTATWETQHTTMCAGCNLCITTSYGVQPPTPPPHPTSHIHTQCAQVFRVARFQSFGAERERERESERDHIYWQPSGWILQAELSYEVQLCIRW